ncbi:MAG: hypothetical protein LBR86_03680 [Tannerella sp.]|jgi:hypothetical protein|nr:hypothetical protein [Tannerella sp.]
MKRWVVISGLALATGLFHAGDTAAQAVSVQVNINIDRQPAWGPAGYDYAAFYYFPELNVYFDVDRALFYYLDGRRWISGFYLPLSYRRYDLYRMYKVVLNHDPNPWIHNRLHRRDYGRFRHNRSQVAIRHAKEHRYGRARSNTRAWVAPEHDRKHSDSHYRDGKRDRKRDRSAAKPPSGQKRDQSTAKPSSNRKQSEQGKSGKSER